MSREKRESARKRIGQVDLSVRPQSGRRIEAKLKFITPMFGGGVRLNPDAPHQKEPDAITPVRGASLRGQLRAWWRRTCATDLSLAQMEARERVLWGGATTNERPGRGLVSLSVSARQLVAQPVSVYRTNERGGTVPVDGFGSPLSYGAFPLQPASGAQHNAPGTLTQWGNEFGVSLALQPLVTSKTYREAAERAWGLSGEVLEQKLWDEVERAWLAFVTFGGLGGRTRRGFGAVQVVGEGAVSLAKVKERLGWEQRVAAQKAQYSDGGAAQKGALAKLQQFRQGVGVGRNPGVAARPGRSRWPDPDEIRRLSGQADPNHRTPIHTPAIRKFPRAAFGLPIIFHFQSRQDPQDTSLQPVGKERMASPIVLRPVVDPDRKVHAVALLLPVEAELARVLGRLQLKGKQQTHEPLSGALSPQEASQISPVRSNLPPSVSQQNVPAALASFLQYFKT